MKKLLALLLISPSLLAGWTDLSDGAIKSSVGDNKIVRVDDVVIFWQKVVIKDRNSPIDQLLMRVVISCESDKYAVLNKASYKKGSEVFKDDVPEQSKPIKEGSLLANSANFLCSPPSHSLILDGGLSEDVYQ